MGRIDVTPDQVTAAGGAVGDVGSAVSALPGAVSGVGGAASEPPATAAALETLAAEWMAGGERLSDDLIAMGELTVVSAMVYRDTDESNMGGGSVGAGGGGGGSSSW